jgi:hypothetical protein
MKEPTGPWNSHKKPKRFGAQAGFEGYPPVAKSAEAVILAFKISTNTVRIHPWAEPVVSVGV